MKKEILLILSFILLGTVRMDAQVFPVTSNIVMLQPSPIFLFDYYEAGGNKLQVTIRLNDFSIPSQNVKLKFTIENGDIEISTKDDYIPLNPIVLTPGVPITLQGSDLFEALNTNNLNFKGITANYLNTNAGKLPEGQYSFCVEVLDYNIGKPISLPACANAFLQLEQAPIIINPICEENIKPSNPQQIRFNWQTSGGGQPSMSGFNTYKLELHQITDDNIQDPQNAVQNSKAVKIFESDDLMLNHFDLNFSSVLLVPGNKYVYRVKATGPNGRETFANNGFSEWCWFSYGYKSGGIIDIQNPFDKMQFSKTDDKIFSWDVSDKGEIGQPYDYKITVVELLDSGQDLVNALTNNTPFHQEIKPTTTQQDGGNFLLTKPLNPDERYAWKVEAFSNGQKVAESNPSSFYSHSLIDYFYASNQKIKVIRTENKDLNSLSGKCRVQLSNDIQDFIDVDFSNLKLRDVSGQLILIDGDIKFDLTQKNPIDVSPKFPGNGLGKFEYISGTIDKTGLKVDGQIKWSIPHNVLPGEEADVVTIPSTFLMNSEGKLSGQSGIQKFTTTLVNPQNFVLELKPTSILQLVDNEFIVNLIGSITLPESIKSRNDERIKIEFKNQQDRLDYIKIDNLIGSVSSGFAPINNLEMEIIPIQGAIIDLSDSESPDKLSADKSWKGIYITNYKTRLHPGNFDNSKQLKIPSRFDFDNTTFGTPNKLWIDGTGLTLKTDFEIKSIDGVKFNSFQSDIKGQFDIKKSVINTAKISGETKIPFLDNQNKFTFDILATEEGLEEGFINQDLTDLDLVYNPYGGENRMEITINRAVFEDNERLSMNIDIKIPELDAVIKGLEDFRVYGDYFIGVGGKNTSNTLDNFADGKFKQLAVKITDFGASFLGGKYALSYQVETNLGSGVSGEEGPPKIVFNSVTKTEADLASSGDAIEPDLEVPDSADANSTKTQVNEFYVNINTPVIEGKGGLSFTKNDPKWGTKFEGGINAKVKTPFQVNLGANFVLGIVNNMDYWYLDAYFEDVTGTGIPIKDPNTQIAICDIVGMEGKIYRHMYSTKDDNGEFTFDLDPNIQFGMAIYGQLIDDYSKGFLVQADLAAEVEIQGQGSTIDNVILRMAADASFLNMKGIRSAQGGSIKSTVVKEVAKEVANQAIDQIFPQSFSLAGKNVTIDAKSFQDGSLEVGNYANGDGFKMGGNVSSTPSFNVGFAHDGFSIGGSASAEGSGSFNFGIDDLSISASLQNMNKGDFNLSFGDFSTRFGGNIQKKSAYFGFDYSNEINLGLDVNATDKSGSFLIDIKGYKFNAAANILNKTASVGFAFDNNKFDLDFDGNDKAASFEAEISGLELSTAFNIEKKTGNFHLSTSSAEVDAEGSAKEAKFNVEVGTTKFGIETNFNNKTGKAHLSFPNNELKGEIGTDFASVFIKKDALEIGANGKFDGTAGALHLKEGSYFLDLAADINNSKGSLGFGTDQFSFTSNYDLKSESFIKYVQGNSFKEIRLAKDYFKLHYKEDQYEYLTEANATKKSGKFKYKIPDFGIEGEFDPTQNLASTKFYLGDNMASAFYKSDSLAINYASGERSFHIQGVKDGSGSLKYDDKALGVATGFSFDKTDLAGALYFKKGDFILDIAGNKTANTGKLIFQKGNDHFKGIIDDSLFVSTRVGDISFSAIKNDNKIGVSYRNQSDFIDAYKLSNGELLSFSINDIGLLLSREDSEYRGEFNSKDLSIKTYTNGTIASFNAKNQQIGYEGEISLSSTLKLKYINSQDYFSFVGNVAQKSYDIGIKVGNWNGGIKQSLSNSKAELKLSDIEAKIDGSDKSLAVKQNDYLVQGGIETNQTYLKSTYGNAELEIKNNIEFDYATTHLSIKNISTSNYQCDISIKNDNYIVSSTNCAVSLSKNGNNINLSIGVYEQLYGGESIKVIPSTTGHDLILSFSDVVFKVQYLCNGKPKLLIENKGKTHVYQIDNNLVKLNTDYHSISYENGKNVTIDEGGSLFLLDNTGLSFNIDNYKSQLSANSFSTEKDGYKIILDKDKLSLGYDDKKVELSDDSYKIYVANDISFGSTSQAFEAQAGTKKLYANSNMFKIEETSQSLSAEFSVDGKAKVQKDNYILEASTNEVKFLNNSNHIKIDASSLSAKYDDKEFSISTDKSVSYKDANKELKVSESELKLAYDGVSMELQPNMLKMGLDDLGNIKVSKELLEYVNGGTVVALDKPFESPAFKYDDGTNSLNLSMDGLGLKIDENELIVNKTKLLVKIGENKLLLTENDLDFKYERYQAKFTDWKDAYLSNGVQEFRVNENELSAVLDKDNKIKTQLINNVPSLEFTYNGDSYNIDPTNGVEFDYAGQHFEMNSTQYLRVHEEGKQTTDGLYIDQNGLRYLYGEAELRLGTDKNYIEAIYAGNSLGFSKEKSLVFTIDSKYTTEVASDMSVKFTDGSNTITLNKGEKMAAYTNTDNIEVALMKFNDGAYGVQAGTTTNYMFVKGKKGDKIGVGGEIDGIGLFEFSANKDKDFGISYLKDNSNIDLDISKGEELENLVIQLDGTDFFTYNPGGALDDYQMDDIEKVELDGPAHIAKISENAGGWGSAGLRAQLSVGRNFEFIANGAIKTGLTIPVMCADASFGMKLNTNEFLFKLAEPNKRAQFSLICAAGLDGLFQANGYSRLHFIRGENTSILDVAVGLGFSRRFHGSASVKVGVGPVSCKIGFGLDVGASFDFDGAATMRIPTSSGGETGLDITRIRVALDAYARAYASVCGYTFDINVHVGGELGLEKVSNGTRYHGRAYGKLKVCGFSKGFDFNVDFVN